VCHPDPSAAAEGSSGGGGLTLDASNELVTGNCVSVLRSSLSSDFALGVESCAVVSARAMDFTRGGGLGELFGADCAMDSGNGAAESGDGGNIT
jgi:hypothetical protein